MEKSCCTTMKTGSHKLTIKKCKERWDGKEKAKKKKKSNIKIPFALEINSVKTDLVYSVISHAVLQYDISVFCFSLCIKERQLRIK